MLPNLSLIAFFASFIVDEEHLRRVTRFLHDVGSIVHFEGDKKLEDIVILSPQWLTRCMATILTTKHRAVRQDGILTHQMLKQLWRAPEYPESLHQHLRAIMERFEVMHPVSSLLPVRERDSRYEIAEIIEILDIRY